MNELNPSHSDIINKYLQDAKDRKIGHYMITVARDGEDPVRSIISFQNIEDAVDGYRMYQDAGFAKDYEIPGKKFSFGTLIMAQSIGDQNALEKRGLKTMRLHLLDRPEGIKQLLDIAKKL
ncbi:MAG: hypothetical protein RL332_451 [Actinomycetota bacterium]